VMFIGYVCVGGSLCSVAFLYVVCMRVQCEGAVVKRNNNYDVICTERFNVSHLGKDSIIFSFSLFSSLVLLPFCEVKLS
jgi:hypothetical protein